MAASLTRGGYRNLMDLLKNTILILIDLNFGVITLIPKVNEANQI
jgi:hypothetical protein